MYCPAYVPDTTTKLYAVHAAFVDVTTLVTVVVAVTVTLDVIKVVTLACCVETTALAVCVEVAVTVLVVETGDTAKEHAEVTILAGNFLKTFGLEIACLCGA